MLSSAFLLQLASSGLAGGFSIFTISYISKVYGVDGFGLYSTLLIGVSLSNALESALQQLMLRSFTGEARPPAVFAYLRSNSPVALAVSAVCAFYFLAGYFMSAGAWGGGHAFAGSFKQLSGWDIVCAASGAFMLSLMPLMSYALIASAHIKVEAANNIVGVSVRSLSFLGVLVFSGYEFPSACALAMMVSGLLELVFRAPLLFWVRRAERGNRSDARKSLLSCVKSSPRDFFLLLLSASLVSNDRLVAAMQFDKSSFGLFAFVYAVVLASAIVPNAYMRSILKAYWDGDGAQLLRPTALRLVGLSVLVSVMAYMAASSYLAYSSGSSLLVLALDGAAVSGYVLATSAMLAGCVQFLCFKHKMHIWHNFLKVRLALVGASAAVLYFAGSSPWVTFVLIMLHGLSLMGLMRSLIKG